MGIAALREAAKPYAFDFGTAIEAPFLANAKFAEVLSSQFSVLEAENSMKFERIHPSKDVYDFEDADALVAFAKQHNMRFRGHTLVWHSQIAKWVLEGGYNAVQMRQILDEHIRKVAGRYAADIYAWDVVNEAFEEDGSLRHTPWFDQPGIGFSQGTGYIKQAFRWANAAAPNAKLFYNDYNNETLCPKSDAMYAMARDLLENGVPIDGVGLQMHLLPDADAPETLKSIYDNIVRFARLGLDIEITELDIRMPDGSPESLDRQAKLYAELVRMAKDLPALKLIQFWGFTDAHSWIPGFFKGTGWALPFDENYLPKPAVEAMLAVL